MVKNILGKENFVEIFVSTPLEECIRRDVKGLYKKALNGEIKDFTGISSPYEAPKNPDLVIDTSSKSLENCLQEVLTLVSARLK
jgi:adenylylsulfate kinase-like enzyme